MTGSAPSDKNKSNLMRADGWQPYSIRIGDKWLSYNRLDPFAITMGTVADLATKRDGMTATQLEDASGLLVASIIKNMGDKTWLSGLSDMFEMLGDPQRNLKRYTDNQTASLAVPAIVSQTANAIDPTRREADGVLETIQSRIPGMKQSLHPQRNIFGEPITTDRLGPNIASPVTQTDVRNDPVISEMLRLGSTATEFPKGRRIAGKWVKFTPEEYDRLQEQAGHAAHKALSDLIGTPTWKAMTPEGQRKVVEETVKRSRADAKAALFGAEADDPKTAALRKARGVMNDPWSGFADAPKRMKAPRGIPRLPAQDEWSAFKDPEQHDVIGNLTKIPGITLDSFTSGYRTPAYQADMKRRGYKPADNSGHLDGSSLDIVVPRGRSMEWLAGQVRKVEPNAQFNPEGDHLHVTFPGWYGAPVLGGAKRAGLRNPNVRIPPRLPEPKR